MITALLHASIIAGIPLLFTVLGEILAERSGKLNLGLEGMMLLGAVAGFHVGYHTANPWLALCGALAAGAAAGLLFGMLTITLRANQVVCGLTLTIFGGGLSSFIGQPLVGFILPAQVKAFFTPQPFPLLNRIPVIGPIFFEHDILVYTGYVLTILVSLYLYRTRWGLNLRAIGENTAAADAAGLPVTRYQYVHVILGGLLAGLGGAYLTLTQIPWQPHVTAGRGWIAVALVIFCRWNPFYVFGAACLFGGLDIIGYRLQGLDINISQYIIDMTPYLVTILIIIMTSVRKSKLGLAPAQLGIPYFREEK